MGNQPSIVDARDRDLASIRRNSTPSQLVSLPAAVDGAGDDASSCLQEMQVAEQQATRSDVRSDIQRIERDLQTVVAQSAGIDWQRLAATGSDCQRDWTAAVSRFVIAVQQVRTDAAALTSLCGSCLDFV
jgi:hypothetical protein